MSTDTHVARIVRSDSREWEQVVFAEVLVPGVVNSYGDFHTKESVAQFAYEFARQGYGIDINHDGVDVAGTVCYVVESFIARPGDPDFIEGSWVVGVKVTDKATWERILSGELNGFSYQALVEMTPVTVAAERGRQIAGVTEPHPEDGHTHTFVLLLDEFNNPMAGGTSETAGHAHKIVSHTTTEVAQGHNHRYQVLIPEATSVEEDNPFAAAI